MMQYVYLLYHSDPNHGLFAIGVTTNPEHRLKFYPSNSKYLIIFAFPDYRYLENILLSKFNYYYPHRTDMGIDYFEGNINLARYDFMTTCLEVQRLCFKYPLPTTPLPTYLNSPSLPTTYSSNNYNNNNIPPPPLPPKVLPKYNNSYNSRSKIIPNNPIWTRKNVSNIRNMNYMKIIV
jgi:hypothetical protein